MPVLESVPIAIQREDVFRREEGTRARKPHPSVLALTEELLASLDEELIRPAVAYELFPVDEVEEQGLRLAGGARFDGRMLATRFAGAVELAAVMCTIGPALDRQVAEYHAANDDLRSVLLDGIGNAALDALAREACHRIDAEAEARGLRASGPLSPGLHGLPLANQVTLHRLVQGERIGIGLTPGSMMVPQKSVSMLIGVGPEIEQWDKAQACEWCNLSRSCAYRISA